MKELLTRLTLLLLVIFTNFTIKVADAQTMAANPFIWGDVPDVCVLAMGNTYYMSSTTMHMSPGVPIMKSTDLVNWQTVNYCYSILASNDALNLANGKNAYGGGSWASSLVYNKGTYYVSTASQTTNKTYIFKTTDIENGTWTVSTLGAYYHDQSLFFDDDGRVYMIYGSNNISIMELTSDASGIKAGGLNQVLVPNASSIAGSSFIVSAEGSHFQKINGIYYLSNICWPSGGGRTQLIHMCSTLTGTYQGQVALAYNGIAQGGFIETPNGEWYAMLFQDNGSVGRSPDLVPVTWSNNWPVLGTNGKVPATLNIPIGTGIGGIVSSDEFSQAPPLKLDWQWNHNPNNSYWSLTQRSGYLRLINERIDSDITQTTNTLTQRTFGPQCSGYVSMDVTGMVDGDYAGLTAFQADYGFVGVKMVGTTKTIVMVNAASGTPTEVGNVPLNQSTVYLRIDMNFLNKTDKANFYYSLDGITWQSIGNTLQMSYTIPHFMGYRYGLFSYATKSAGGYVDFDFFRIGVTITAAENSQNTCSTAAPTVTSPVTYCQQAMASALTAAGTSLKWYTSSTGGTSSTTAPTPSTTTSGTTTYYVSQTIGCEGPRASIVVTVNPLPVITPYVQLNGNWLQQNTAQACVGSTIALGPQPVVTNGWTWTGPSSYTSTVREISLANLATTQGGTYTANYTDANGCKASSNFTVTVNAIPSEPTVITPVTYCQNATASALTATGTSLKWYTSATGGTGSTTAPTPSTTITGTTSYYVSQTNASDCESPRATIAVTVNAIPSAPTVTTPVTYCQNATASTLTATGTSLKWYTSATGGTGSTTAPVPSTTSTGTSSYYVSQTTGSCESPRATIAVTVNALPVITPYVQLNGNWLQQNAAQVCAGSTIALGPQPVVTNGWAWTGPNSYTSTARQISLASLTTAQGGVYIASYTDANGCTASANYTITVNAIPSAPTVNSPVTYCQNSTATALIATGTSLNWYTSSTGGTASTTAPTPSTAITGTTSYYVSQTTNSCESPRSIIAVTVDAPPTVSNAGTAQYITTMSTALSANTPSVGTGAWTVVSGTGTFTNPTSATTSVSGLSMGANILEWTISNSVCPSSSSTVTINVGNAPSSQMVSGSAHVQANATGVTYSVPATAGVSKVWTVPAGATITSYNSDSSQITVDFGTTSGNVSVNESNVFGSVTPSLFVAVGNSPSQQTISGSINVADNTSATYSITTPSGVTNHWTVPTGATIISSNPDSSQVTISFGTTGGTVNVTQTNSFGSTVDSQVINVGNSPVTQTVSGPAYIATGSIGITYSISDNTGSTYHWTLPSGATITSANTDSSQITVSYGTTVETGTVSVTETNPYGSTISTLPVSIGNAPSSQSISGTDSVTAHETGVIYSVPDNSGSTYHWMLPPGATITSANADSSQITVSFGTTGGAVSVTVTNPYGTTTSSSNVSVSAVTGLIGGTTGDSYEVYPNPFSDYTTIILHKSTTEPITVTIINTHGVICYSSSQYYTNQEFAIGSELTDGLYFVQLACGNEVRTIKLVKLK